MIRLLSGGAVARVDFPGEAANAFNTCTNREAISFNAGPTCQCLPLPCHPSCCCWLGLSPGVPGGEGCLQGAKVPVFQCSGPTQQ